MEVNFNYRVILFKVSLILLNQIIKHILLFRIVILTYFNHKCHMVIQIT